MEQNTNIDINTDQKERILCAAIIYHSIVVAGRRHSDCYETLINLLKMHVNDEIPTEDLPSREQQGFLTSHNRFVSRSEAFKIAKENKQIIHKLHDDSNEGILISEDLY